jgi:C-terminal processing protease CtpA/Prc
MTRNVLGVLLLSTAIAAGARIAAGGDEEEDAPVAEKDIPRAVLETAKRFSEDGTLQKCSKGEEDGLKLYELVMKKGDRAIEVQTLPSGGLFATEEKVASRDVPDAVKKRVGTLFKDASKVTYERAVIVVYECATKDAKGKTVEFLVNQAGAAFKEVAGGVDESKGEEGESGSKGKTGAAKGFLGIQFAPNADGAVVASVLEGTPAQKAGLKAGDRIVVCGETKIASGEELAKVIGALSAGDTVKLRVERDGWAKWVPVKLGARPVAKDEDGEEDEKDEKDEKGDKGEKDEKD